MSSKGDFIISSWNIAGSLQDYSQINPEVKAILEQNFTSQAEADTAVAQASQIRDNVESIAANSLKESADVFCLQEVGQAVTNNETNDRIIISTLENANYTICRAGKNSDRPALFRSIAAGGAAGRSVDYGG